MDNNGSTPATFMANGKKDFAYGLQECKTDLDKYQYASRMVEACNKVFSQTASGPQFQYARVVKEAIREAGYPVPEPDVPCGKLGTFQMVCYKGSRNQETRTFRNPVNVAEMVNHCNGNSHIWFTSIKGDARQAKVNGKVRTWKRQSNRIEVPLKYGMYEYGTFTERDIERVLIPV